MIAPQSVTLMLVNETHTFFLTLYPSKQYINSKYIMLYPFQCYDCIRRGGPTWHREGGLVREYKYGLGDVHMLFHKGVPWICNRRRGKSYNGARNTVVCKWGLAPSPKVTGVNYRMSTTTCRHPWARCLTSNCSHVSEFTVSCFWRTVPEK